MVVVAFAAMSCRREPAGEILARVGDASLTREEAIAHIDTLHREKDAQLMAYVTRWVNIELLHQEAIRLGIDKTDAFRAQLDDAGRALATQMLLERDVYNDDAGKIPVDSLQSYFTRHAPEFVLREDMIRLRAVTLATREQASNFAARVSQGLSWDSAVVRIHMDTSSAGIISLLPAAYYTPQSLYPRELWKVAEALGTDEVSFPVKLQNTYTVVQMLAIARKGTPATFDLVRDEVTQRYTTEHRRQLYEELLGNLRKRYNVSMVIHSSQSPDSTGIHE